jgi:hypothetical protein
MDYAFGTNTLAEAVKTKIKDLFVWMLVAKSSSVGAAKLRISRIVYL